MTLSQYCPWLWVSDRAVPPRQDGAAARSLASKPPSARQKRVAVLVAGLLILAGAAIVPFASVPLRPIPGFMPAFGALACGIDLVTAVLLFSQGRIRAADPSRLGVAYLFSCLIIIPHLAAFPGAFLADPLLGTSASAVWLWFIWHGGFPGLVSL
jgi:hypothetical protein